ncbi:hypothetical protein N7519_004398 [Penicillium mononematosum]|uniref:uncharacterized protein n=1 Tax=Penicillium mononematosum TaxID=268346 RepID=UPI002547421C|nr:uncharacterized protein N7519_004398 [Penicillium mononematosum]KAJ6189490.1 hypothetical protein N7519_004398 [Penicillium mononematosum]
MNSICGYIHNEEGQDRLTVYLYLAPILSRFQNGQQIQTLEFGTGPSDTTKGNVSALVPLESLTDTFTGITLSLMATTRPNFSRQFRRFAVSDTEKDPGSEMLRAYDTHPRSDPRRTFGRCCNRMWFFAR